MTATVNELIQQATDERNLALLFAGESLDARRMCVAPLLTLPQVGLRMLEACEDCYIKSELHRFGFCVCSLCGGTAGV